MSELTTLHTGTVPLARAFWSWAIAGGLIINLLTTFGFLILTSADHTIAALIVGYGVSIPYNIWVTIGVVRSASNPEASAGVPSNRARAFVAITILGALILSLT
jgi:hypothetical protein